MTEATKKPAAKKTTRKPAVKAAKPMSPLQKALLSGTSPYAVFTAPPALNRNR